MKQSKNAIDKISTIIPNKMSLREFRRSWERLIQKVYKALFNAYKVNDDTADKNSHIIKIR